MQKSESIVIAECLDRHPLLSDRQADSRLKRPKLRDIVSQELRIEHNIRFILLSILHKRQRKSLSNQIKQIERW